MIYQYDFRRYRHLMGLNLRINYKNFVYFQIEYIIAENIKNGIEKQLYMQYLRKYIFLNLSLSERNDNDEKDDRSYGNLYFLHDVSFFCRE